MDIETLKQFLRLSDTLHFGRASRECHVSVSALSRSIQRLEEELGAALFERNQRGVQLTQQGAEFRLYAAEAWHGWLAMRQQLKRDTSAPAGTIRIFASVTACQSFLPRALSRFRERYAAIHIELETGYAANALDKLHQGSVDVTVAALPARLPKSLTAHLLVCTPLSFVAPVAACDVKRQVERRSIDWGDVPLVLPPFGLARQSADSWFRRRRLKPRIYSEVLGHEAILALVSLGCGVGIVPELVVEKSALKDAVRVLDIEPRLSEFRVAACTQKSQLSSPIVAALWETLGETV